MLDKCVSVTFFSKDNGLCLTGYRKHERYKKVIGLALGIPYLLKLEFNLISKLQVPSKFKLKLFGVDFKLPVKSNLEEVNCIGFGNKQKMFTWSDIFKGESDVSYGRELTKDVKFTLFGKHEKYRLKVKPFIIGYNRFYIKDEQGYSCTLTSLLEQNKTISWVVSKNPMHVKHIDKEVRSLVAHYYGNGVL